MRKFIIFLAASAAATPVQLQDTQPLRGDSNILSAGLSTAFSLAGSITKGMIGRYITTYKPTQIETLQPSTAQGGRKKIRMTFGPFELKPASFKRPSSIGKMDPNSDSFAGLVTGIPTGALVLSTNSSLTYKDGSIADVVNGVYNHHLIIADANKVDWSPMKCIGEGLTLPDMGLLMGASEANRDLRFSSDGVFRSGFKVDTNDTIMLSAEIVNYTNDTKNVYSVSDIEYIEGVDHLTNSLHASLHVFDISTCDSTKKSISAPPGQTKWTVKSKKVKLTKNGYILSRRGHMHDGGESVDLLLNGKRICNSVAVYGGAAATTIVDGKEWKTISKMETCSDPVKVAVDDVLEIQAHFDVVKHPARKHSHGKGMGEEMGLMTFMFAPTSGS